MGEDIVFFTIPFPTERKNLDLTPFNPSETINVDINEETYVVGVNMSKIRQEFTITI